MLCRVMHTFGQRRIRIPVCNYVLLFMENNL